MCIRDRVWLVRGASAQIENSLYEIKMNVEESCKILCTMPYKKDDLKEFESKARARPTCAVAPQHHA
eukprot:5539531-Prymnesium_polylepis.1